MGAVVVVVLVDAVVLVALVVGGAVAVAVVVAAAPAFVEVLEPPVALPQAASSKTSGSRARRFMGTFIFGTAGTRATIRTEHGP